MKFLTKPQLVDAFQFQRRNDPNNPRPDWFEAAITRDQVTLYNTGKFHDPSKPATCCFHSDAGQLWAEENDWIVRDAEGGVSVYEPAEFVLHYEPHNP